MAKSSLSTHNCIQSDVDVMIRLEWDQRILRELHKSCTTEAGQDDQKKGTQLLELYSLEIQMHTEKKDNKKLRATYEQAMKVAVHTRAHTRTHAHVYLVHNGSLGAGTYTCTHTWKQNTF